MNIASRIFCVVMGFGILCGVFSLFVYFVLGIYFYNWWWCLITVPFTGTIMWLVMKGRIRL